MQVLQMATSKMLSQPLYVAAKLGIADLLVDGPLSVESLAQKTKTHADSLYRVLRALASVGVFEENEGRTFRLTPKAETLCDRPGSTRGMVLWFGDPAHHRAWENLLYSVYTGKPGFDKAHGKPVFQYFMENRELSEIFNQAMTGNARNIHAAVLEAYDFAPIKVLYDIGGGHGHLMAQVLAKTPGLKGGVFDLPHVVEGARKDLASAGLDARCECFGGDFFAGVPGGADAHIMSFILHDWSDDECVKLLGHCAKALPVGGRLLVMENVVAPGNAPSFGKLIDLEMLVMTTGRERSQAEFAQLFARAGFALERVVPTKSPVSLLEARRV
ncbi:MAG: methyltransferase [Deltaproteobacteria bacterium]|nr:methyltransferase [Deltaproteobacteria bacterium]